MLLRSPPHLAFFSPHSPTYLRSLFILSSSPRMSGQTVDPIMLENFPKPLSPPLPAISKSVELSRAMTAAAKSSVFNLSRSDVVFEDEWLIVVNKPQGVYCERVLASVPDVLDELSDSSGVSAKGEVGEGRPVRELHLANRLDRDTSGAMIITKSNKVAAKLVRAFTEHKVKKTYIALCVGVAPEWETVTVRSGHGRSKFGAWRVYAASDVGRSLPGGSVVRDMETAFQVLSVNGKRCVNGMDGSGKDGDQYIVVEEKSSADNNLTSDEILIRASPRSGRTHQIRLHCQYLGIPIRGDVKYEGVHEWRGMTYNGHELHAESLSLEHPVTGDLIMFHAPLPSWASDALQSAA
uniref:Pseudouridine synthase RsuA/RluA-like domain-containing protein n=1 Tax=Kalanchoe fedtschenkoi TaxID=63787 RepID=A0A7N0U810_KALFE